AGWPAESTERRTAERSKPAGSPSPCWGVAPTGTTLPPTPSLRGGSASEALLSRSTRPAWSRRPGAFRRGTGSSPAPRRRPSSAAAALARLRDGPASADELTRALGLDAGVVVAALAELELNGLATESAGVYRGG